MNITQPASIDTITRSHAPARHWIWASRSAETGVALSQANTP